MPILNDSLKQHTLVGSKYGFSGTRIDQLGASEYTLVAISADSSGSVHGFAREIEGAIKNVVQACAHSPRAENLMLRLTRFNTTLEEVHGFKPLMECDPDSYDGSLDPGGGTSLYDAAHNAVESITNYGCSLKQHHFEVNGILFVITDGEDNSSTMTAHSVKEALTDSIEAEQLQALTSVLIGVNVESRALSYQLRAFSTDAGFDHYIQLDQADADSLAKLAKFVTQSIAIQSRALAAGELSTLLTF